MKQSWLRVGCLFVLLPLLLVCTVEVNSGQEDKIDRIHEGDEFLTQCMYSAKQNVKRAIHRTKMHWKKDNIWDTPMELFQFFKRPPNVESEKIALAGDVFEMTVNFVNDRVREKYRRLKRRVNATDVLSSDTLNELAKFAGCRGNRQPMQCTGPFINKYRTINGECNNLNRRYSGASNFPLVRWLPSQYENDFNLPTGWDAERIRNGFKLPLVRKVSNDVIHTSNANVTDDELYSHMIVVWGQYIDHDLDFTPQSLSTSTFQGLTNCKETCMNLPPCFPMRVPEGDPRIQDAECLPFFRSAAVCGSGETSGFFNSLTPREQINAVTSFVDASTVYGSTDALALRLRNMSTDDGLLRLNERFSDSDGRGYLPFDENNPCVQDPSDASGEQIPCFLAGDGRVSEHLTLSTIHTIWVREHNRLARELKKLNSHWKGERLYHEARKIVGALHQVVQYREYIPKIIGDRGVQMMGDYNGYNSSVDPSVSNVFATAAFRFGHVTIAPMFRRLNDRFEEHEMYKNVLLHLAFFSPWRIIREGGMDPILRGLIGRPAKLATPKQIMPEELREKLFLLQNKVALDLASLNLQRGRDHALPHYNDWREFCNLSRADAFDDVAGEILDAETRRKVEELYGHPGNLDLWLAGLIENSLSGARVGPTFMCLLALQFKNQRDGDRFFYQNPGVHTPAQVEALDKMRFSNVVCANSGLTMVQRDVFALAEFPEGFMSCSEMGQLDLEPWRETPQVGTCGRPVDINYGEWIKIDERTIFYICRRGYTMEGGETVRCMDSGRFDNDPPMCVDVNECMGNNGECQVTCENTMGSFKCSCMDNQTLNEDGKTCSAAEAVPEQQDEPINVAAIVTGVVLGLVIVVIVLLTSIVIYRYISMKKSGENEYSNYRISGGISNTGFQSAPSSTSEKVI